MDNTQTSHFDPGARREALLNVSQAADFLGVSVSYLNKMRLTGGGVPFIKIGARISYDPADLRDFVAKSRRTSTSEAAR